MIALITSQSSKKAIPYCVLAIDGIIGLENDLLSEFAGQCKEGCWLFGDLGGGESE